MLDYIDQQRVGEPDHDRPFGDLAVDSTPIATRRWPDSVHPGLDDVGPSVELAAWVSTVDRTKLSGSDRLAVIRAHQRLISHYQAQMYRDMHAIKDLFHDMEGIADRVDAAFATEAEVRVALTWTRRRAETELCLAMDLHERHPDVLAALDRGSIDVARARTIVRGTEHLDEDTASRIGTMVLEDAEHLTTGEINARVRALAAATDTEAASRRFANAHDQRRVVLDPTVDGTANVLGMDLSPDDAAAATRRINRLARRARTEGDDRTADQLKADVFIDLLLGRSVRTKETGNGASSSGAADLEIRVDLTTLIGLDDTGAELAGYGPIIAEIARDLARRDGGRWTYTVVDPVTGSPTASGPIRRRPNAEQRRSVRSRRPTCVFPGCRAPAVDCDLDHTRSWASGGETSEANLAPLCRYDHRVKGEADWRYVFEQDESVTWQSPLGPTYRRPRSRPPPGS
jgi:hypothetical protein